VGARPQAWNRAGHRTSQPVTLRLDTNIALQVLAPSAGTFLVEGPSVPVEVIVRATGMAETDRVWAAFDTTAERALLRADEYASATLNVAPEEGEHTVTVAVRDASGAALARSTVRLNFTNAQSIPLQVVQQEPSRDATDVEANAPITLHFNRPIDPSKLTMSVLETAHGKVFEKPSDGSDITTQSVVSLVTVARERAPVPGVAQNLPGNRMITFYPSQDYAYAGTVYVELDYDGSKLWHSKFSVRPLPTLVHGFVTNHLSIPLQGIEVSLPEIGRTATTNDDGNWSFGFGDTPAQRIRPGRYRMTINRNRAGHRFGSAERFIDIDEGLSYAGTTRVVELNAAEPLQRIASRQASPAVLAHGDLQLDLSETQLTFADGQDEGDVYAQFLTLSQLGNSCLESAPADWAFGLQPAGTTVSGSIGVRIALPELDGSHAYVDGLPEHVVLLGLDERSLMLLPVGIARVDRDSRQLVSVGSLHITRLDYLGISTAASDAARIEKYLSGELSIAAFISATEAE
jgi:hypothetical protein